MFALNSHPHRGSPVEAGDAAYLDGHAAAAVEALLALCPAHRETPLASLAGLARELGLASIAIKNEAFRFRLDSFKALGGTHAVLRLVLEEAGRKLGRTIEPHQLRDPDIRRVANGMTVGCATAGNHGRAVAAGARLVGCRAVIFVHASVKEARIAAMAALGAEIRRVAGTYDEAVAAANRVCAAEEWTVVSDTSWAGYERIPLLVMQGYTALAAEALRALPQKPTHVFLQAGVGGFAASVGAHLALRLPGEAVPRIVVVEPARAACLFESHRAGAAIRIAPAAPTVMATLECYEPSLVAWRILTRVASAFMTVAEDEAVAAARLLTAGAHEDAAIGTTESGAAGLAGLLAACRDPSIRAALDMNGRSRILLVNTEGAMT